MSASFSAFLAAMGASVAWHMFVVGTAVMCTTASVLNGMSMFPSMRRKRAGVSMSDAWFLAGYIPACIVTAIILLAMSSLLRTPIAVPIATLLSITGVVACVGVNLAGSVYDTTVMRQRMSGSDSSDGTTRRLATYGCIAALVGLLAVVATQSGPVRPE
jgi:Na+/citrate or Na+/malate symporter